MLRIRFTISFEVGDNAYKPVIWPIKYPYWLTGENDTDYIIVSYVDSQEDLYKQWPEAQIIDEEKTDKIIFTTRFPKPEWYNP